MKRLMLVLALIGCKAFGIASEGYVLTVIHDDRPVREFVEDSERRAALPFGSEYKLRLANNHKRRATAEVLIDGAPVSKLGNIVIPAEGNVTLERFLDASLTEGKRFKFVTLEHPDVDNPGREENGLVEVRFRLEKERGQAIYYIVPPRHEDLPRHEPWRYWQPCTNLLLNSDIGTRLDSSTDFSADSYVSQVGTANCSATLPGATVEGGISDQRFSRIALEEEETVVILKLRLKGIPKAELSVVQ
jgi:hypothetical protein